MSNAEFNEMASSSSINRSPTVFSHHQHHGSSSSSNKPNSLKHKYLAQQSSAASELVVLEPRPPNFGKPAKLRDHSSVARRHRFAAKTSDFLSATPSPVPPGDELERPRRARLNDRDPIFQRQQESSPHRRSQRSKSRGERRDQDEVIELLNRTTITNRPLSSRLSKYTEPLPQIGHKFTVSHNKKPNLTNADQQQQQQRSTSSSSILLSTSSTFNDADADMDMDQEQKRELLIGIRLPDGRRLHCQVDSPSSTTLLQLVEQGVEELRRRDTSADPEPGAYALLLMPNVLYRDLEHSLDSFGIEDRTMFFLINKQNL